MHALLITFYRKSIFIRLVQARDVREITNQHYIDAVGDFIQIQDLMLHNSNLTYTNDRWGKQSFEYKSEARPSGNEVMGSKIRLPNRNIRILKFEYSKCHYI